VRWVSRLILVLEVASLTALSFLSSSVVAAPRTPTPEPEPVSFRDSLRSQDSALIFLPSSSSQKPEISPEVEEALLHLKEEVSKCSFSSLHVSLSSFSRQPRSISS